jgi:PAS domain S-box-containing protein
MTEVHDPWRIEPVSWSSMLSSWEPGGPYAGGDFPASELLEATSRSLSDALALSDANGDVLAVNAAYSKLYGFAEPEVVGRSFAVIFPEEERTAAETAYREVFQSAASPVFRTSIRRADGADRRVESRITFIERRKSRVAMLSVIRDVTTPARVGETVRGLPTRLDMGALASMYETHARSSLGYAHALLRDVAQAEQVVEDALLATWRAGVGVEHDDATARLLLFSVVRRSAVEVLASRIRTRYASGKVRNYRSFVPALVG